MTRAVKETEALTVLHELKERVKRGAAVQGGGLRLTMRQVLKMVEGLEEEVRRGRTGEETCHRCGGPNLRCWHAPSPLWNAVMRTDGLEPFSGIICPRCFGELAREKGVSDFFCLTTHDAKVPLASIFGDGRVWDAASCMWVEPTEKAT